MKTGQLALLGVFQSIQGSFTFLGIHEGTKFVQDNNKLKVDL